ncbi:phage baseplate protein [Leptolyngbya sp. AN10]|uniref:T4 family baseplate hub assembly chaperone n=1 Tax=Leptolyngbya sp. AN10 TaxID=3423365 RepID=UPI003D31F123
MSLQKRRLNRKMRSLSAQQIIQVWELGQRQHFLDRAITMLSMACPEQTTSELAALSIGQRDAYLLRLRELTFGNQMTSLTACPHCQEKLESTLNVSNFRIVELQRSQPQVYRCRIDSYELQFRLANSWDLAAIAGQKDAMQAKTILEQRCLLQANLDGQLVNYDQLPTGVIEQFGETLSDYDPQAEILLSFDCPACGHQWNLLFDIVAFFWTELTVQAKRLLHEVHVLARFYGWREIDILSMTTARRQLYLGLVS